MSEPVSFISEYNDLMKCGDHPSLVICDARSDWGKTVLTNRDGETDFDGFHHAYILREGTTFMVPLWEWKE